jgi:signal transduction histidine kinase
MRSRSILVWMVLAIALVTALAYWDEERESQAGLEHFALEQTTLSASLATALGDRLAHTSDVQLAREPLRALARAIEKPGAILVLLAPPMQSELLTTDDRPLRSAALAQAMQTDARSFRLSRPEAAELGLPARTAIAGLTRFDTDLGRWTVAVVATAQVERDRELGARNRLVLGVLVAAGLVLAFGGVAVRMQRKELLLAHELSLAAVRSERDERLVRADKLATMGAMATGIAHEVATPLSVILGRAEQLLPKQTDDRARRAVEAIAAQTERINVVIRGFLALARGSVANFEHHDPAGLARAAVELVEHRFEQAAVELATDIASDLPKVPCEPRLFEQVLVNLLLNACDACEGSGRVRLTVRAKGDRVCFAVIDNGVGIRPDHIERVTEPFFTTKPEGKGTGLGLAIATEIVKHHCGRLVLEARDDARGTCATVEVPAAAPAMIATAERPSVPTELTDHG